jgi:streptogramin lyase
MRATRHRFSLLAASAALAAALAVAASAQALPQRGSVQLFPLGKSIHAMSIAFDSRGVPWFIGSAFGEDRTVVGNVTAQGDVTEYALGLPAFYSGGSIVAGPDGGMWFTNPAGSGIGRITTDGEITQFPLTRGVGVNAITVGRDGNLWFVESKAGRIGRITPSGEIAEFDVGPRSEPTDITVGPDGNLWFTLQRASAIGRIKPSGSIKIYQLAKGTGPLQIVAADGGLWFTEGAFVPGRAGLNKIGRISVNGKIRQLPVPAQVGTDAIAAGPEGNVWFSTGPRGAAVESISPHGKLGRRLCLNGGCTLPPSSLGFAPDGTLWFTTGQQTCVYCGGGSQIALSSRAGFVGRFGRR